MSDAELALAKQREIEVERTQADIKRTAPGAKEVPALRIVRTGLEGQREQIEREEMRKAAGAEHTGGGAGGGAEIRVGMAELGREAMRVCAKDEDIDPPHVASFASFTTEVDDDEIPNVSIAELLR